MKNPLPLGSSWNRSVEQDALLVSIPGINKKFKRKSREPKRLFTSPDLQQMSTYPGDVLDCVHDVRLEACDLRQGIISQEPVGRPTAAEDSLVSSQSAAIDMRIGVNMPDITPKISPFPEISHWPTSISQPLSNRLKFSLHSTFSLSTSSGHSPSYQPFSLDTSSQTLDLDLPRALQSSECQQHAETNTPSAKESPRKRVSVSADGVGCVPEIKAIQQTRRLLANARERSRVHTISAAFEALRKQVPCYSYGQKLSKLAILRIACNYILSLAQLAELDYSSDHSSLSFSQCVEQCTRTLQAEGRSKKRKVGRMLEDV